MMGGNYALAAARFALLLGVLGSSAAMADTCNVPSTIQFVGVPGVGVAKYNDAQFVAQGGIPGVSQVHPCEVPVSASVGPAPAAPTTQWVSFTLRTKRYFNLMPGQTQATGNHIPVLMRARFGATSDGQLEAGRYQFRGPIFHQTWGVLGEYADFLTPPDIRFPGYLLPQYGACEGVGRDADGPFHQGNAVPCAPSSYAGGLVNSLVLRDDVDYEVIAHASANGVAYLVIDPISKTNTYRYFEEASNPLNDRATAQIPANDLSANGGFAIAVICNAPAGYAQGSCDGSDFSVTLSKLRLGWF